METNYGIQQDRNRRILYFHGMEIPKENVYDGKNVVEWQDQNILPTHASSTGGKQ